MKTFVNSMSVIIKLNFEEIVQLRAGFHDTQAEGDDLRLEQEIDHIGIIDLNQSSDNS